MGWRGGAGCGRRRKPIPEVTPETWTGSGGRLGLLGLLPVLYRAQALQFQFDAGRPKDLSFCNTKTLWVKWHDPRESCLIHKNDLINQFANAKATLSQFLEKTPVTTMSEDERAYHLKLRRKVAKLEAKQDQHSPNHKYELREHFLAIQHGYGTSRDQVRHHAYSKRK